MEMSSQLHTPAALLHGTHQIKGSVDQKSSLDGVKKRNISFPCRESKLDSPVAQPLA
jgi:hypothetical protein